MKPPYEINNEILKLVALVSEKIGEVNAKYLDKQSPQLRKQNKIKTIHASLQIEGNALSEEQVTAIIENKKVLGSAKDILEVQNAIKVYEDIASLKPTNQKHFLKAHQQLMKGLIHSPGQYRIQGVAIVKGAKLKHIAPSYKQVPALMNDLFNYLLKTDEISLIKSCVFHYEMEFIHPFSDGNGRMGRLWQTVILKEIYPVFEFLPIESVISKHQKEYYKALAMADKMGKSTPFIAFMLKMMVESLNELTTYNNRTLKDIDRLTYFITKQQASFTRKDYMNTFTELSSATASRDLRKGIELGLFEKYGDKKLTVYKMLHR